MTITETCCWPKCPKPARVLKVCDAHAKIIHDEVARPRTSTPTAKRENPKPADIKSVVYYLEQDGVMKIGHTINITRRLSEYPPRAKLLATEPGGRDVELARHRQFRNHLIDGREWFRDCDEIRSHIADVVTMYGNPVLHVTPRTRKWKPKYPVDVRRAT